MKPREIYRVSTTGTLAPFGDLIRDSLIVNETLAAFQEREAQRAGLKLVDIKAGDEVGPGGGLVIFDDIFLSAEALVAFAEEAAAPAVAVLGDSVFANTTAALQGNLVEPHPDGPGEVRLCDLFLIKGGARVEGTSREEVADGLRHGARRVVVDPQEKILELPVLEHHFGQDKLRISLTGRPIIRIRHWMHLLLANQTAIGLRWRAMGRLRLVLWALWAMIRSFSINKYRILGRMNVIGAGCDIHPSAVVEASVIGPGCTIGPHARVRFSTLGQGVIMQPGSQAEFAVIGDRSLVSQGCAVNFSLLYPEAAASHYLVQLCVLGRRATTVGGSFLLDTNFGASVKVMLDGRLHDTGRRFLGTALGHDVRVGSGVWLAAGREIPNGYMVVRSPDDTAMKIPDGHEGVPLIVSGGTIVPW